MYGYGCALYPPLVQDNSNRRRPKPWCGGVDDDGSSFSPLDCPLDLLCISASFKRGDGLERPAGKKGLFVPQLESDCYRPGRPSPAALGGRSREPARVGEIRRQLIEFRPEGLGLSLADLELGELAHEPDIEIRLEGDRLLGFPGRRHSLEIGHETADFDIAQGRVPGRRPL